MEEITRYFKAQKSSFRIQVSLLGSEKETIQVRIVQKVGGFLCGFSFFFFFFSPKTLKSLIYM